MSAATPTVFVTSATGTQGEAVSRQLRQLGWTVHATARDLNAPAAKHLESLGVKLTQGDWDNEEALKASIAGCNKIFLNMVIGFDDPSKERVRAKNIIDIAKAAGVKDIVYSSGVSIDRLDELPLIDPTSIAAQSLFSKQAIEKFTASSGFDHWTILRGAFFMPNFLEPKIMMYPGFRETSTWTTALKPETQMPMVDCEDIAKFAVAAFQDPVRFHQQGIVLAGDLLTPDQMMERLSAATGRELNAAFLTDEEIETQKKTNPFIPGYLAMRDMKKFVDFDEVKSWGIPLGNFKQFLEREKEALKETYP